MRMVLTYFLMGLGLVLLVHTVRKQKELSPDKQNITKDEARVILGVAPDATEEDIREAHRRLIQKNHPDQGGSAFLATQINCAKDVLLK